MIIKFLISFITNFTKDNIENGASLARNIQKYASGFIIIILTAFCIVLYHGKEEAMKKCDTEKQQIVNEYINSLKEINNQLQSIKQSDSLAHKVIKNAK